MYKPSFIVLFIAFSIVAQAAPQKTKLSSASNQMKVSRNDSGVASQIELTPTIGLTNMKITGAKEVSAVHNSGMSIGALANYKVHNHFAVESGLLYNQFGSKFADISMYDADVGVIKLKNFKINLNYISVPALAKYTVNPYSDARFYLKAGLMPSYLVSHQAKATAEIQGMSLDLDIKDIDFKKFDAPVVIGLGSDISLGQGYALMLSATYLKGLFKLSDSSETKIYSEGFVLATGLSIPL